MKFLFSELKDIPHAPLVERFANEYSPRSVLDVETGSGGNAIYLAKQGFVVTAIDREEESVVEIREYLKTNPLPLMTEVLNLKTEIPDFGKYDAVIFFNVLHYLKYQRGKSLLQKAVDTAKVEDVYIVSAMTTEGDFFKTNPDSYYLKPGELKSLYEDNGWKMVSFSEGEAIMRARYEDGTPMKNVVTRIIAEKL